VNTTRLREDGVYFIGDTDVGKIGPVSSVDIIQVTWPPRTVYFCFKTVVLWGFEGFGHCRTSGDRESCDCKLLGLRTEERMWEERNSTPRTLNHDKRRHRREESRGYIFQELAPTKLRNIECCR
jgi:hypothetical protein